MRKHFVELKDGIFNTVFLLKINFKIGGITQGNTTKTTGKALKNLKQTTKVRFLIK
jgi:hypothetical protein